ncbi:alpha/beta hydrolase [Streptomyces sp. B93]|uniref:alpha/beta hydrolase n=1 Tax=Streptomyces sp. B93 TaxID=2824875 RepID=UPI001B38E8D7|nr:alpha/beta hydrolase [Streptomyces sp. B93]MBQ1090041.1 alpha/beta hydrolase [Streptomyces sp. B93]
MSRADSSRSTILLVHGAWHGAWAWEKFVPELTALGRRVETVDLPSASADENNTAGMYDDARVVRERLAALDGPVTVLAHSYGGIPATEAVIGAANVSRLIYVAAFMLDAGESIDTLSGGQISGSGAVTLSAYGQYEDPRAAFYPDAAPEDADRAAERLVLQSARSFCEPLTEAAWKTVPASYVIAEHDTALVTDLQVGMAGRAERTYRVASGHSPFLSVPAELARLVDGDAKE